MRRDKDGREQVSVMFEPLRYEHDEETGVTTIHEARIVSVSPVFEREELTPQREALRFLVLAIVVALLLTLLALSLDRWML